MPIKESVSIEEVIEVLNRAVASDRKAIAKLRESQVECNEELAKDPTIQVNGYKCPGKYYVGFLGLINGFFGIDDDSRYGAICAEFSDSGELLKFRRVAE